MDGRRESALRTRRQVVCQHAWGLYGWKGQGLRNDTVSDRADLDKLSWYAGAGVGYNLGEHFSIGANYDHYNAKKFEVDLSTDMASVNAEYRF